MEDDDKYIVNPYFKHGTVYGFMKVKCQCDLCLKYKEEWYEEKNAKRRKLKNSDGILRKYTDEEFIEAVQNSSSKREALQKLALASTGKSYETFDSNLQRLGISTSHFNKQFKPYTSTPQRPIEDYLNNIAPIGSFALKKKLLTNGFFENQCAECGQLPIWNDKPLALELDHIDGNNKNNSLDNLRILCLHCHSQTETYRGRNIKLNLIDKTSVDKEPRKKKEPVKKICKCGKQIDRKAETCKSCVPKETKITWPSPEEMKEMVWKEPTLVIAQRLGVSDQAINKYCRKFNIDKPPRGYWAKKVAGKI